MIARTLTRPLSAITFHQSTSAAPHFAALGFAALGEDDLHLQPDFLSPSDASSLYEHLKTTINTRRRGKRWESGHFDGVIFNYKELELSSPSQTPSHHPLLQATTSRVHALLRAHLSSPTTSFLPTHCIVLRASTGHIAPHVDSVKFSGSLVCGISLGSERVMRLRPADPATGEPIDFGDEEGGYIDMKLSVGSLYIISNEARYRWTHEILNGDESDGGDADRISLIFRDAKTED